MRREEILISRGGFGAMAGAGSCLSLKPCRTNLRNVGFAADHVCFTRNGRPRRRFVDTAVFYPMRLRRRVQHPPQDFISTPHHVPNRHARSLLSYVNCEGRACSRRAFPSKEFLQPHNRLSTFAVGAISKHPTYFVVKRDIPSIRWSQPVPGEVTLPTRSLHDPLSTFVAPV